MRILAFLFLVSIAQADIIPNHMAQSGLLTGATVKLLGGSEKECWWGFAIGAALGAVPDVAGAVGGSINGHWEVYHEWHRMDTGVSFVPQIRLHLWVDLAFHDPKGGWYPNMVPLVIFNVIVEGVLIWLFTRWVED